MSAPRDEASRRSRRREALRRLFTPRRSDLAFLIGTYGLVATINMPHPNGTVTFACVILMGPSAGLRTDDFLDLWLGRKAPPK